MSKKKRLSWEERAQVWDAYYNFSRPINEQYLNSYKALLRLSRDWSTTFFYFCAMCGSIYLQFYIWLKLGDAGLGASELLRWIPSLVLSVIAILLFIIDTNTIFLAYNSIFQRDAMGTSKWATKKHLQDKDLLEKTEDILVPKEKPNKIPLVPFGRNHYVSIPINFFAQHGIVVGPSGCGKTSTVFINLARYFSRCGSMIALDISKDRTGEFYGRSAHYYDDASRIDFMYPEQTDHFDLFAGCKGNSVNAGKIAHYIIKGASEKGKSDIWETASEIMLKCLILHLCEIKPEPQPADIFDFLAANPTDGIHPATKKPFNKLKFALENSPNDDVQVEWKSIFSAVGDSSPKTYGSVVFTMTASLGIFRDPNVQKVFTPPTESELRNGRRTVDIAGLRRMTAHSRDDGIKRGKAVYVVVSEGESKRLQTVIGAVFAVAKDILKKSGGDDDDAYVLFALDEAKNANLQNLSEDFGVGRGRKMIFFLGLQGISQLTSLYGRDVAQEILENTGTYIIFPGAKDNTAEWACKMLGKTTTLLRSASDAVNDNYDSEKLTEHQRDLMMPTELTKMKWYTQLVVLINDAAPIRARVNPDAKTLDTRICRPRDFSSGGTNVPYEPLPVRRAPIENAESAQDETDDTGSKSKKPSKTKPARKPGKKKINKESDDSANKLTLVKGNTEVSAKEADESITDVESEILYDNQDNDLTEADDLQGKLFDKSEVPQIIDLNEDSDGVELDH